MKLLAALVVALSFSQTALAYTDLDGKWAGRTYDITLWSSDIDGD